MFLNEVEMSGQASACNQKAHMSTGGGIVANYLR